MRQRPITDPDEGLVALPTGLWTRCGMWAPAPYGGPENVRVRGVPYRVRYHTDLHDEGGARLLGACAIGARLILIEPHLPRYAVRETLGHELAHVYLDVARETDAKLRRLSHAQVEALCDLFAEAALDLGLVFDGE